MVDPSSHPEIVAEWAAAYLAAGCKQGPARAVLMSRGKPWTDILSGSKSSWPSKTSRLTVKARELGLVEQSQPRLKTLQTVAKLSNALKPMQIRSIASAQEILERLSEFMRGTAPELAPDRDIPDVARAKISIDAARTLADLMSAEMARATAGAQGPSQAERYAALRERMAALPAEVRDQVLDAVKG